MLIPDPAIGIFGRDVDCLQFCLSQDPASQGGDGIPHTCTKRAGPDQRDCRVPSTSSSYIQSCGQIFASNSISGELSDDGPGLDTPNARARGDQGSMGHAVSRPCVVWGRHAEHPSTAGSGHLSRSGLCWLALLERSLPDPVAGRGTRFPPDDQK